MRKVSAASRIEWCIFCWSDLRTCKDWLDNLSERRGTLRTDAFVGGWVTDCVGVAVGGCYAALGEIIGV
jgi:hypothetical protein